jgi:hypothetical protein
MKVLRRYRIRSGAAARVLAAVAFFGSILSPVVAHGAVALLLEQPYGKLNLIDPAGHSAIYLNHVCAETPLKLRPCHAGELGVVLSRYDGIGNHDWVAMPLVPYLYAVSSAEEVPDSVDKVVESNLRNAYRRRYLQALAPDLPNGSAPDNNWYELVGSAFDRTIYGFQVSTTTAQDAQLIAEFNDGKNVEKYNGMFRNCADFARVTINRYYPHAVRRNYIADLGLTSPKSVARGLAHYAHKHPNVGFTMFVVPQVKGDLPRSHSNTDLAEGILKRFSIPLVVVSPVATGVVVAAYVGHGRFAMPRNAPVLDVSELPVNFEISRPFPASVPLLPSPILMTTPGIRTQDVLAAAPAGSSAAALVRTGLSR